MPRLAGKQNMMFQAGYCLLCTVTHCQEKAGGHWFKGGGIYGKKLLENRNSFARIAVTF